MSVLGYYADAMTYIMGPHDEPNEDYFILLQEVLTPVRFYLSCRVCNKLLQAPLTPDHNECKHTVCQACIGRKMKLKPACGWCKTYENFIPNKTLAALIKCYSKLCVYVMSSSSHHKQLEFSCTYNNNSLLEECKSKVESLLVEGSQHESIDFAAENAPVRPQKADSKELIVPQAEEKPVTVNPDNLSDIKFKLIKNKKKRCNSRSVAVENVKKKARQFGKKKKAISTFHVKVETVKSSGDDEEVPAAERSPIKIRLKKSSINDSDYDSAILER